MNINLFVRDETGQLQPIEAQPLTVIPRIGETVSFGTRKLSAKVEDVEYLLPLAGNSDPLVAVVLDHAPQIS